MSRLPAPRGLWWAEAIAAAHGHAAHLTDHLLGGRCGWCGTRSRHMVAHVEVNHLGEDLP